MRFYCQRNNEALLGSADGSAAGNTICEKYGFTYYAFYETLLRAVRHKGFIPWDDDIDIAMKREDYVRFLQVAGKELPAGWHMRSIYEEEEWTQYHAIVTNELVVDISEERLSRFHGCLFVTGVDIFPLDYFPRDRQAAEVQKLMLNMVHTVVPSDYDKVLRAYYGDYTVFERNTQEHGYPIYKKELAMLHERGLWLDVQE